MNKVNLDEAFSRFSDLWNPKVAGEVSGMHVKLAKLQGEFIWHHHQGEDELFLVVKGSLLMRFRDGEVQVNAGEFIIVPHGVEHLPVAEAECNAFCSSPGGTLNTGNVQNDRTVRELGHVD